MSDKQLKELLSAMAKAHKQNTSSEKKARAFLVKAGIVNTKGKLTAIYR
ncbi:MAG: hypothetical protein P4M01_10395 [Acidobacteriota bacterium]|nr:hypothetical protein [Acidobacteriota bacterium]